MRKICVFTGTRAEYGLLYWTMRQVQDDLDLQLQILVSGAHLSERLGATYRQIEADGFVVDAKVPMNLEDDSDAALAVAMGQELAGVARVLDELKPDILVLLGDRYETFTAATAAMMLRIPIAHIHGGEVTEGALDDAMRHGITKMAHLHFTAAEPYRQRVIQLGENPDRVFNVGAPGLEAITRTPLMNREDLAQDLGFFLDGSVFVVTYHPETLGKVDASSGIEDLLQALNLFPEARIILTKANADSQGRVVNDRLETYAERNKDRVFLSASLGQRRYYSAVALADVVIGNSSSGIIEAPALGTPSVNIGDRQKGRLRAASVVDCAESASAIATAIDEALHRDHQISVNPYGTGETSSKIITVLKAFLRAPSVSKTFFDQSAYPSKS